MAAKSEEALKAKLARNKLPQNVHRVTAWRRANPEKLREFNLRYRRKSKAAVMAAYGGACACCGETELVFLTIDHINNDGAAERKAYPQRRGGDKLYVNLRVRGYPAGYQVLCWNCNLAKSIVGVCPHRAYRSIAAEG